MFDTEKFFGEFVIEVPEDCFKIVAQIPKEEFAPGVWAGTEGLELTVTKVDLTTGTITLERKK